MTKVCVVSLVCLGALLVASPVEAGSYGVCRERPVFERSVFERSVRDRNVHERSLTERPIFERSIMERSGRDRATRERPVFEKPVFDVPCARQSATTARTSSDPLLNGTYARRSQSAATKYLVKPTSTSPAVNPIVVTPPKKSDSCDCTAQATPVQPKKSVLQ